ncbi:hypothetical protein [Oricola thermophila]|uniref:Uncharacterized protein n=1 Tax=Oricola thermophila TaxID=2742145 RepID=A0A6N1VC64_9HYPH|nr:hypothetical protein [Oricola thermophila]QKV17125.1 hypothetical protein HTY61_00920 [Oricola thermophila]
MSDIGILSGFDLFLLALIAGAPGAVVGAPLGAWLRRGHRLAGAAAGCAGGFALGLGAMLAWVLVLR